MTNKAKVVAIEEHFWSPDLQTEAMVGVPPNTQPHWYSGLSDLAERRIKEMDEARIDLQVISHAPPGAQTFPAEQSIVLARQANDMLHEAVRLHPRSLRRLRDPADARSQSSG